MSDKRIPIVELFGSTVQGEGALCGQVSYFIRSAACSYECSWCDSMHAVDPKQFRDTAEKLTPAEIVDRICKLAPKVRKNAWVTLTGGDPVLWDMERVVVGLRLQGFRVAVETQAHLWREWLSSCDLVTASPKPPSSGMADRFKLPMLQKYVARLQERMVLKIVCFDEEDLEWAAKLHAKFPKVRFFLSSGTPATGDENLKMHILSGYRELVDRVLANPMLHDATVLPQVHALLWGRELGR